MTHGQRLSVLKVASIKYDYLLSLVEHALVDL